MKGVVYVEFVSKVKYLGITIYDNFNIIALVSSIYCTANMICARFFKCSL